ncbi:MAG: aminotransferase class V-fold PLP-dependent enzyme, partial [Candidatus Aenigmarchaeota archaeon]|nr:aminotransferase class V-fold PLP-dependent enzyme [Candidatus Aenigmarchaeota archaeon]
MNFEEVRSLVPILKDIIYLSNGNIGICNTRVKEAMTNFLSELESGFKFVEKWSSEIDDANNLFAELIGGRGEEVVGIPNTTTGINLVAHMIDPERGSNVVVNDLEFNTSTYPWLSRRKDGVDVKWVNCVNGEILLEDVEKAVDDQTSALVVSHVSWISGFRQNLKALSEIAHDHGAYLIVDAAQSTGAVTIDVKKGDIDFLACCSFKWLLGPPGAGFLYVRRDLIEKFEPPLPGYMGVQNPYNFDIW